MPEKKNLRKRAEETLQRKSDEADRRPDADVAHLLHDLEVHQIELELQNEELQEAHAELKQARDAYADLYDFAPVGYLTLDQHNIIKRANLLAGQLLGMERKFLIGRRFTASLHPTSTDHYYRHRKEALATGLKQTCEAAMQRADGSVFYARLESLKFGTEELRVALIDITEQKQAEARLQERSAQLSAANSELEAFAYTVAHDLRAPLRAIDGYTRMLLRDAGDKLAAEEKRKFDAIRDNARIMGQLIDDLLTFSRLGRQTLALYTLALEDLINDVWKECLVLHPGRKMELTVEPLPRACGDRGLVRQVLTNLLTNAVKFTKMREEARIEIGGREEAGEAVYYIRDNGIGFDMRFKNKLFGVFQRLHGADEFEGTGVGLAIVQRIIQRHGGRVWAEGKVNEGATFYFTLPEQGKC